MQEHDAAVLMQTVIKALIHCHSMGVVHRDIKLENIVFNSMEITDYSDIQVVDFGLSKHRSDNLKLLNTVVGKGLKNIKDCEKFCILNINRV